MTVGLTEVRRMGSTHLLGNSLRLLQGAPPLLRGVRANHFARRLSLTSGPSVRRTAWIQLFRGVH